MDMTGVLTQRNIAGLSHGPSPVISQPRSITVDHTTGGISPDRLNYDCFQDTRVFGWSFGKIDAVLEDGLVPVLRSAGTRYFFLSMSGMSLRSAFSQIT